MKKLWVGLIAALLVSLVQLAPVKADVNDFVIRDFTADYYLGRDSDGRSTLKTVEKIIAEFPDFDQNHGIERALPQTYDDHLTSLTIQSIKDENNRNLNYTTYKSNDNLVLRIGDADTYVHGLVTYVITYNQKDVTRYFADTNKDEFYWDTNGNEWSQEFDKVTARIHLDSNISNKLTGSMACYYGISGSTSKCQISKQGDDTIYAEVLNLGRGENLTFSIGFNSGTFGPYEMSAMDFIRTYGIGLMAITSLVITAIIIVLVVKSKPRKIRIVVPQYLPPKDADLLASAAVLNKKQRWFPAMIIDLAVRHKIKVLEVAKKKYALELVSVDGLSSAESSILSILFDKMEPGAKYDKRNLSRSDKNDKSRRIFEAIGGLFSGSSIVGGGAYITKEFKYKKATYVLIILNILLLLAIALLANFELEIIVLVTMVFFMLQFMIVTTSTVFTQKAIKLKNYLSGLKMYIKLAEEDRLKVLQSPEGANKTPVDINDKEKIVHLYERVLPYAVMMGIEKNWARVLGNYYEQTNTSPDWYAGSGVFNAAVFTSTVSSIKSSGSYLNSYSPSSSSISGGSTGGGFSGGGGGGGGGGGW